LTVAVAEVVAAKEMEIQADLAVGEWGIQARDRVATGWVLMIRVVTVGMACMVITGIPLVAAVVVGIRTEKMERLVTKVAMVVMVKKIVTRPALTFFTQAAVVAVVRA
tara:strand:+ start:183 stop:506 length:324 start_codon:yes stop_codon:yes gene_type:complete